MVVTVAGAGASAVTVVAPANKTMNVVSNSILLNLIAVVLHGAKASSCSREQEDALDSAVGGWFPFS